MGTANPSKWKLHRSRPSRLPLDGFWWINAGASAWNAITLAIDVQEHVFIFMEYGATGRGQGTRALLSVAPPDSSGTAPQATCLSCRKATGLGGKRDRAAAGRTPSCHGSPEGSSPENAEPESFPGPECHSLHAVPSLGTSGLLWNVSILCSHHAAICNPGASLTWGPGQAGLSPDSSQKDPGFLQELQAKEPRRPLSVRTSAGGCFYPPALTFTLVMTVTLVILQRTRTFSVN